MARNRHATIFGGSGFIGGNLAHRLVGDGWTVRVAVRNPSRMRVTGQRRALIKIPFAVASVEAAALEWLPKPPLTRDQVKLLKQDNVASPAAPGLGELGLTATPIESVIPAYLGNARAA